MAGHVLVFGIYYFEVFNPIIRVVVYFLNSGAMLPEPLVKVFGHPDVEDVALPSRIGKLEAVRGLYDVDARNALETFGYYRVILASIVLILLLVK